MRHRLAQIAADGSQKLPIRILPVLRAERAAGRMPDGRDARARRLGLPPARAGAPVDDVRADELVAARGRPAARRGPPRARRPGPGRSAPTTTLVEAVPADAERCRQPSPAAVRRDEHPCQSGE